jgi:hypothetical protein
MALVVERAMTVTRPQADLAPLRYQLPVYMLLLAFALATLFGTLSGSGAKPLWLGGTESACFMIVGATWTLWPNGKVFNPLAVRVIGALMFVVSLFSLVKFFLHHLI